MGEKGGAPSDVLAPILGSDLPAIRKLELAILYRAYLDTQKIQGYRQEYARIAEHKIQEAIEWIRSDNGKAICREFGLDSESLIGGQKMGKPEPLDMQAILAQQVKLAASMERLQEAIGPVADAIRRGMTYDLVRNKRVQITAGDRVEMYAGKDAEAIAIRVDHNLAAGDFTYWVGGRAYTALSYAYNHSNATPDEIVIPLDERGDKIEFSSTVTGVLTYTGLTLQQALPKMLTQLAVVRAVGIVGAGATPADPVYSELTGRSVTELLYQTNVTIGAGATVYIGTVNTAGYQAISGGIELTAAATGTVNLQAWPETAAATLAVSPTNLASISSGAVANFTANPTYLVALQVAMKIANGGTANSTASYVVVEGRPN